MLKIPAIRLISYCGNFQAAAVKSGFTPVLGKGREGIWSVWLHASAETWTLRVFDSGDLALSPSDQC